MIHRLLATVLLASSFYAQACEVRTIIIDGKVLICTICPTITTCN